MFSTSFFFPETSSILNATNNTFKFYKGTQLGTEEKDSEVNAIKSVNMHP